MTPAQAFIYLKINLDAPAPADPPARRRGLFPDDFRTSTPDEIDRFNQLLKDNG